MALIGRAGSMFPGWNGKLAVRLARHEAYDEMGTVKIGAKEMDRTELV